MSRTRESAGRTEQHCPCTFSRLCPNQPATLHVRGLYLRCSNRNASAPLESCTACTMRSAASSVITRISYRCRETWICSESQRVVSIGPCAGSSVAVTSSGYLSPLHMMYALNLKYHSCHFVPSPRKTGGFPSSASRRFIAGCVAAVPGAAPLISWSLWTCAVNSAILRWSSTLASPIRPRITVSILVSACSIIVTPIQLSPT